MMNRHTFAAAGLALALCFQAGIMSAETDVLIPGGQPTEQVVTNGLNRLGLSVRMGYNINARFRSTGGTTLHASGSKTPHGDPFNYDDGYVLTDSSGSAHNQTWYWGYNNLSQINADNSVTMHRHTLAANPASGGAGVDSDDLSTGLELTYNRELGRIGKLRYGIEGAVNYLNIFFHNGSVSSGAVTETADTFYPAPLTTIPTNSLPYRGNFTGPNFVITNIPLTSITTGLPGTTAVNNRHEFNADIFGFRLGPYLEYPLVTNLDLSISGGLAVSLVDDTATWTQTAFLPGFGTLGASGGGDRLDLMWGYYLRANLGWQFSQRWSLNGGIQYQDVGQLHHQYGSQAVDLDLSKSLFFTGGIAYRF